MTQLQQETDERFLLFEDQIKINASIKSVSQLDLFKNEYWIWSDRLILIRTKDDKEFWNFIAFDLLMNEASPVRFPKDDFAFTDINFIPLDGEYGFFVEKSENFHEISFVKLEWDTNEFQLIQYFNRTCQWFCILFDKMDPSKFVFQCFKHDTIQDRTYIYQLGKFIGGKIKLGQQYRAMQSFNFYSKDRFISATNHRDKIVTYDLNSEKMETFEIDGSSSPDNMHTVITVIDNMYKWGSYEWVNDRFYIAARKSTFNWGLLWTDLVTKRWTLLDFKINLEMEKLEFFGNNLIVCGKQTADRYGNSSGVKIYNIPVRRPQKLRYSAWILVVKIMKNYGEKDPYEAAKEFLPLNSDLREPWFKDEEKVAKN